jgi:predicted transcriptional regulator
MVAVLWHCYLSPERHTQLAVAAMLGVSDSLVSECRRRIEQELRALSLTDVDDAREFEAALNEHVSRILGRTASARSNSLQVVA